MMPTEPSQSDAGRRFFFPSRRVQGPWSVDGGTNRGSQKRWGKARAAIGEVGRAAARQPQLSLALDPDLIVTPCGTYTKMVKQPRAPPRPSTHSHSHSQTQTQTRLRRLLHPGAAQENQRNSLLHL